MTAPRPTLAVLAAELGISRTTVSNAFSRPDQLSPALRDRIMEAATRLGYTGPDPLARSLARGRVGVVGLLLPTPAGFAFADPAIRVILDGLVTTLAATQTALLLLPYRVGGSAHPAATVPLDGFVLLCADDADPVVTDARQRGLPLVAIDQPIGVGPLTRIDDYGGALAAARHVRQLGHRHVGIVTLRLTPDTAGGPFDPAAADPTWGRLPSDRLRGYLDGLGRDARSAHCWESARSHRAEGRRATCELLAAHPEITALVFSSDELALGALDELQRLGRRVPEDVSVVGFDDVAEAATAPVPLTTVHQPLFERGAEAGRLILALIAGRRPRRPAIRPVELVVRSSTGPPPR